MNSVIDTSFKAWSVAKANHAVHLTCEHWNLACLEQLRAGSTSKLSGKLISCLIWQHIAGNTSTILTGFKEWASAPMR